MIKEGAVTRNILCPECSLITAVPDLKGPFRTNCLKCNKNIFVAPDRGVPPPQVADDAHYTASTLITEITDLRAQLAGEKAVNARLQGLLNQATVRIVELQRKG
jgi:uncharacterized paraquat-inducible protein A